MASAVLEHHELPYLNDGLFWRRPCGNNLAMHSPAPIGVCQMLLKYNIFQDVLGNVFLSIHQPTKAVINSQGLQG